VAVSHSGNVFVAESNGVIRKYSPSGTSLAVWKTLAPDGTPEGIAVDVHGDVYVTDAIAGVIDKLSPTGALLAVWGRNWPEPKMNQPWGITVDTDGVVYVVETNGNVVDKIAPNGTLLARWGSPGHAVGQLNSPRGITLDGHGHIYVADSYNGRILEYSKTGTLLRHWGGANWSGNKYFSDHAIAVVSDGFYVAVTAGGLVQHYSFAGKLLQSWGRDGGEDGQGAGRRQFNSPQGLALDSRRGYLYVADSDNRRIERLSLRENSR
jgi:streptogramin lyase